MNLPIVGETPTDHHDGRVVFKHVDEPSYIDQYQKLRSFFFIYQTFLLSNK